MPNKSTNIALDCATESSSKFQDLDLLAVLRDKMGARFWNRIKGTAHQIDSQPDLHSEAEAKLEDVNYDGIVIRWVQVPRGHRLPRKSKKASTLAEVVSALQAGK
ncbi:hypothetical protein N7447_001206 [Penicillium robsamsonii]|uniref:uncharacterized protein n=1 Tax=Penicillium robsamsonii TaxID=1792511 RepID=UPI002546770F|nr:uncharacterized protein N7447_001206 [Penicillium robsamsonii]KAJ5835180.1 hypothetical protein N7447_001206 [Penicillium robsamsonii]